MTTHILDLASLIVKKDNFCLPACCIKLNIFVPGSNSNMAMVVFSAFFNVKYYPRSSFRTSEEVCFFWEFSRKLSGNCTWSKRGKELDSKLHLSMKTWWLCDNTRLGNLKSGSMEIFLIGKSIINYIELKIRGRAFPNIAI